jgi:hypothetical protein
VALLLRSCQENGGFDVDPVAAAIARPKARIIASIVPVGIHAETNARPPGRSTRRMSPIASSADGAKMAANTDRTTSNDSVGKRKRLRLADDHRCVEALARQTRPCHLHDSHRRVDGRHDRSAARGRQ